MPHSRSRSRSRSPRPTRHDRYRDSADRDRERRRDERGDYRYRSRERDRERDRDRDRRRHHDDRSPKHASGSGWELAKRDKRDSEHGELQRAPKSRSGSPPVDKTKPNFNLSGKLAAATNTIEHAGGKTTLLKYNEPPEARKPGQAYRLYVFKGDDDPGLLPLLVSIQANSHFDSGHACISPVRISHRKR
jgi:smad nuclear-interacting protein 1